MTKKTVIITFLFLISLYLLPKYAFAGAWTVPKHKLWSELYLRWHWADEEFGKDHKRNRLTRDARTWGWVMEPKFEFGVTDWLNLLFSVEYKEAKYKEYDRPTAWGAYSVKNNGISFIKIGGKLRFLEEPVVLSGQIKAFIYPGYGNNHGDDPEYRHQPAIGDGEDALEFRALLGKEFYINPYLIDSTIFKDKQIKCYIGLESGYRLKNRSVANDIPLFVEGGFWPFKWLLLKGEVDGYISHRGTGSIDKDYAIWRVGPVLQFLGGDAITRQDLMMNVEIQYGQVFWGRKTNADQEIVLKFQFEF